MNPTESSTGSILVGKNYGTVNIKLLFFQQGKNK